MPRLSALAQQGLLTAAAAQALSAKSINSVEDLLFLTCNGFHDVMARTGMCEGELQEIVKTVSREYGPIPQCASDVYTEWYRSTSILSTGSAQLDSLLKGGLFSGEITELAGPCAAGKTQVSRCWSNSAGTCSHGRVHGRSRLRVNSALLVRAGVSRSVRAHLQSWRRRCLF